MENNLQTLVQSFVKDPRNPQSNLELGQFYDGLGQYASALSFYLRAAELSTDEHLAYDCLIRNFLLFRKQTNRTHSAKGQLLHALALCPTRPEAYFHLTKLQEEKQEWQEMYTTALQGWKLKQPVDRRTTLDLEYPGDHLLLFQRAVAGWWVDQGNESRLLFRHLLDEYKLEEEYSIACRNNLNTIKGNLYPSLRYKSELKDRLAVKFEGLDAVEENNSQTYQDIFVLTMLNGKKQGRYLEIGAGDPFYNNNTALLESAFEWTGASIELSKELVGKFNEERVNRSIQADATEFNYTKVIGKKSTTFDYLQVDCEPPSNTFKALQLIPLDTCKFGVITYEHDYYADETKSYREKSREYLTSYGYELIVGDISADMNSSYEDWWVHPELVDRSIIDQMKSTQDCIKRADLYMQGFYR